MTIPFERFRFQSKVESFIGCNDLNKWQSYLQKFKEFEINSTNLEILKEDLHADGIDYLYKGIYSISNGLFNIYHGYYSWSIVKFYYAIFYLIRSYHAAHNIGFLKNNGLYSLKLTIGETPFRRDCIQHKGERVTGDHKTTIVTHEKEFLHQDILLSNNIGDLTVYDWLMEIRNQVNYRERTFNEPDLNYFPHDLFDKLKIKTCIENYFNDETPIYCFQEDHACIAAPIKALQLFSKVYYQKTSERLNHNHISVIENMLRPMGLDKISGIKEILYPT